MRGFIDLHSHFIAEIDDGARDLGEGQHMLSALHHIGFDWVIATPHMRPGLYDNSKPELERAFERTVASLPAQGMPKIALASEHYFDDVVLQRILGGEGLPYPGGKAVLIEFYTDGFPLGVERAFSQLQRAGLLPVVAHPERYRDLWRNLTPLERLVDAGAATLLDTAAMVGKYGSQPQRAAERILELGLYHAACSDAHRPQDAVEVQRGMMVIEELYGSEELESLFISGPSELLAGRVPA